MNNRAYLKTTRKELRNNQTKTEKIFWDRVRAKQFNGIKFRRQHSVGRYILDFYSVELKLCIEIDGGVHLAEEAVEYDQIRTEYLESIWIRVVRFTNDEITNNLDWVMNELQKQINL